MNTTKAQHTKGPINSSGQFLKRDDDYIGEAFCVPDNGSAIANAQRLAHCWNCHDELLEVCQMVASSIKVDELALITAARAAIAKATNQ